MNLLNNQYFLLVGIALSLIGIVMSCLATVNPYALPY